MSQVTVSGDPSAVPRYGVGRSPRHRPMDITLDCYRRSTLHPCLLPSSVYINSHGYTCSAMVLFFVFFFKGKQCFVALPCPPPIVLTEVHMVRYLEQ